MSADDRPAPRPHDRAVGRIEAFSDGVFAIAITLIVLQLQIPGPNVGEERLGAALVAQLPKLGSFVLSFWVIGRYWMTHHFMFGFIRRHDGRFLFLNLLLLLLIAFLPFPTELLGEHSDKALAVVVYAGTLAGVSLATGALWTYATSGHRLVDAALDPAVIRAVRLRAWWAAAIFAASIPLVLVHRYAAFAAWMVFFALLRLRLRARALR